MWKFKSWDRKDKCLFLIAIGLILCILAFPVDGLSGKRKSRAVSATFGATAAELEKSDRRTDDLGEATGIDVIAASANSSNTYERILEDRVKEVLKHVEGVGTVDVLIVLKASAEKVVQMDISRSKSISQEKDSSGGSRDTQNEEEESTAIFTGTDQGKQPVIQKEFYPEISGIVISAAGGGNPSVNAEITAAMEALFGLPANKIKVLKRAE